MGVRRCREGRCRERRSREKRHEGACRSGVMSCDEITQGRAKTTMLRRPAHSDWRMGDFRHLRAWQEAKRLAILSRDAIRSLPRIETYALGTQWQRAAYSVVLNIAEGASQASRKQFCRYLEIAKGSLDELQGVLDLADALGYVPTDKLRHLRLTRTHCAQLLVALRRRLSAE